jgi:hypothetical protein
MPARAERGERCFLEHVCYTLCVPRGHVPHRPQESSWVVQLAADCQAHVEELSGPGEVGL